MFSRVAIIWILLHRLKLTFLLIFFSMNFGFLKRYSYNGNIWLLLTAFTVQNFGLHLFNNFFDTKEDELTGQRQALSSSTLLLSIAILATILSAILVWYGDFDWICYSVLLILMLAYSIPFAKNRRIKNILYLKNITGSLFWWYIPFTLISAYHTQFSFWRIFTENAITLGIFLPFEPLWDIKDSEGDIESGIKTIPNQFGLPATKLLVVSAFLLLAVIRMSNVSYVLFFLFPLIILTCIINQKNKLLVSQIIMLYVASYTFAGNILLPEVLAPWFKK